ncbi:MAG: hypothetical protein ACI8X3_002075 [Saprospiraceae bacterium]|jgi:hypothetical protein
MEKQYQTLKEFYPYYLTEHSNYTSRALHFIGTGLFIGLVIYAAIAGPLWLLAIAPVCAYGFAWVGHFGFEKNKPASLRYPLLSLASDFIMFYHILTFQISKKMKKPITLLQETTQG